MKGAKRFMANVSERVNVMKKNFMALHNEGYTIPEIATKHDLCWTTVYRHLQEIADENEVTREELLQIVKTQHNEKFWKAEHERVKVDSEVLAKGFEEAKSSVSKLIREIDNIMED